MKPQRTKDPTQLPVQINLRIPFYLREALVDIAHSRNMSQSELVRDALTKALQPELSTRQREESTFA